VITLCLAGALAAAASASAGERGAGPTLAIVNARVWTADPACARAEAVAIEGERILAVGTNEAVRALVTPSTTVLDALGHSVLPGFTDAHFHLLDLREPAPSVTLRFAASRGELVGLVAEAAAAAPAGAWLLGDGWDERKWGGALPTRDWIDRVTPRNPVWLTRAFGAVGLANSLALAAAGIDGSASQPQPRGVVRDHAGRATGLLRGDAIRLVDSVLVEPDRLRLEREALRVAETLLELGVTSVHHSGSWKELLVLEGLRRQGRLGVRVYAAVPLPAWERLRDFVAERGRGDHWLRWGGLKLFQHAWTTRPPAVTDGRLDRWAVQPGAVEAYEWFAGASRADLQIMVHAGGIEHLRFFERVRRELRLDDPRFRIEHAHDASPVERALYASAGVIASVQPALLWHHDSRTAAGAPPPRHFFPCRDWLDAGVRIAFGTDAITASPLTSPFRSIRLALERPGPDGRSLSLEQCLRAHTIDAAFAGRAESDQGSLEPGKLADLVVLDRDLFASHASVLDSVEVALTVVGGKVTFRRPPRRTAGQRRR
jgi:predicted amidohydrolase YtcJ